MSSSIGPGELRAKMRAVDKHNSNAKIPSSSVITRQMIRASGRREAKRLIHEAKMLAHKARTPGGSAVVQ